MTLKAKRHVESLYRALWVWAPSHLAKSVSFRSFACCSHWPHFWPHPLSKDFFQSVSYLALSIFSLWALSRLNITVSTAIVKQDLAWPGLSLSPSLTPPPDISWHKSAQIDK